MKKIKKKIKIDTQQKVREFVKVIHLKLKNHKPQNRKAVSLYDMIIK